MLGASCASVCALLSDPLLPLARGHYSLRKYLGHARGDSSRYAPLHCLSAFADVSLPKRLYGCILGFCVRSQVVIYLLGPILAAVVPFVLVTILFVLGKLHGYARGTADQVLAKRWVRGPHVPAGSASGPRC